MKPLPLLCAAYALVYAVLSLLRFESFHAQIDLSYYIRIVWGLAHGQYDVPLVASPHLLGLHAEPILLPFALLCRLGVPIAPLLLVSQAVSVSLLPLYIFRFAKRLLPSEKSALLFAIGSLLYPTVTVATLHDFHPITLALPFLAAFLDALEDSNHRRALLFGGLSLACREDIALQLALVLFCFSFLRVRLRFPLLGIAALLVSYFVFYIVLIQPRFVPPIGSYSLHFGSMGTTISSGKDLLLFVLRHPIQFGLAQCTFEKLQYLAELLWPLGFVPLLGLRFSVGILPILGLNFLSSFPGVRSIQSHYSTAMVPFLLCGAIFGLSVVQKGLSQRLSKNHAPMLSWVLLCLIGVAHVLYGGSPLALRSTRFSFSHFRWTHEQMNLRKQLKQIPPDLSVAARPSALAFVADRKRALSPPEYDDGKPVDVVVSPDATPKGQPRIGNRTP